MISSRRIICVATAVVAGSLVTSPPAYAGDEDQDVAHHAGSQIAVQEGTDGDTPSVRESTNDQVLGHDVSGWQEEVDWQAAKSDGAEFVYIKATEGTGFTNDYFTQQYNGSYDVGMIRGAYHFARPDISDGSTQADYFLENGGGWSADGQTLPGALDLEHSPYGENCYDLDPQEMVNWISSFTETYQAETGRAPTIYTSASWWELCTDNSTEFGSDNPLWLANYAADPGELPAGWDFHTVWQFDDEGTLPGDQNYFNGTDEQLATFANG